MGFWRLTKVQEKTLLDFVRGLTVYDLGAGDLSLARLMAKTAKVVHAIDKDSPRLNRRLPKHLYYHHSTFEGFDFPELYDCAVLCWPPNTPCPGLLPAVSSALHVVYIGRSTDGWMCGTPELFIHLSKRYLAHERRNRRNCLHCYATVTSSEVRFRSEEEVCGMLANHTFRPLGYGELLCKSDSKK